MTTKILRGIIGDGEVEDPIEFAGGEGPTTTFNEGDKVVVILESYYEAIKEDLTSLNQHHHDLLEEIDRLRLRITELRRQSDDY